MSGSVRRRALVAFSLMAVPPASAADLGPAPLSGRFVATCEHLGRFCTADACGSDQIDAALACRAACPGSVTLRVVPAVCALPPRTVLRRRG